MATKIWLDSETFSPVNIKRGVVNYTEQAKPILITYAFDDEPVQVWQEGQTIPKGLVAEIAKGTPVYAHNALFDYLALKDTLGLTLHQMRDTMAIATANHLPAGLEQFCSMLGAEFEKLSTGKALIRLFCVPNKAGERALAEQHPEKWGQFIEYAVGDVEAMREATKMCYELSDYEQKAWVLTQQMNLNGVSVNIEAAKHFIKVSDEMKHVLNTRLFELTGVGKVTQNAALLKWVNEQGVEADSLNKANLLELLGREDVPETVKQVLRIRRDGSLSSLAKYGVFVDTSHQGRIKGAYMYHGASTGRYASRGGLNLQNIPRGSGDPIATYNNLKAIPDADFYLMMYGTSLMPFSTAIRPTIEAPEGYTFVNYDYSSIENRVAPWIGDEPAHLELFRNGLDEYKDFATEIYRVPYDQVTKDMRQMAKPSVLGAVFGSGAKGLQGYYGQFGMEIEIEEAERLVRAYRNKHKGITKAWYAFGKAAMDAVVTKGRICNTNRCRLVYDGRFLRLRLPSGRVIQWFRPRIEEKRTPWGEMRPAVTVMVKPEQGNAWVRRQLIGSSIFQSVVQATARDILVEAMLRLRDKGYKLVMTTHDEIQAEVPENWNNTAEFEQLMTDPPEWGKEIPLAVEGWIGKNYRK